jgi:iron complex outermembrane recepter protein
MAVIASDYRAQLNRNLLQYFSINPIRPEQVRTIEAGYRASITDRLYFDGGYYLSVYSNFIGFRIGLDVELDTLGFPVDIQAFRYSANSTNQVITQGLSAGLNYYIGEHYTLNGNYSWNQLVKTDENDPIIPAFNTPEHKFNVGIAARSFKPFKERGDEVGFSANYKWIQGFLFEGSPQFTGLVPAYDLVDAQVNYLIAKAHTTFKLGCSNLLNNRAIQTYGGPVIGRLAYLSITYEM